MNKLNQREEASQTKIPLAKSEISSTNHKEYKKLTRLPFYKLEELKKQEEKKAKQRHKANKKEEVLASQSQSLDKSEKVGKKKRIILKKSKDDKINTKLEDVVEEKKDSINKNKETNIDSQIKEVIKIPIKIKTDNYQVNKPPDHSGKSLQTLKYSTEEIIHKKIKLSRKQRKLQEAENTLGSFLSKEDKSTYFPINTSHNLKKYVVHDEHHLLNNHDKNHTSSSQNMSSINNTNQNVNSSHLNINSTVKKTDNNTSLILLGKKKKRINKFKKAVYKYRFKKKQFIFNNVFKLENEKNNVNTDGLTDNKKTNVVNEDIDQEPVLEKANKDLQKRIPLAINEPIEKSLEITKSITVNNDKKPNFIEKIDFYAQHHQQGLNNFSVNNNQTSGIAGAYNLASTINSNIGLYNAYNYNNYHNIFYQYNYPYYYPQYYYPSYPMNMYNNQPNLNHQVYNYSNNNTGNYYNKFNMNMGIIPAGEYNPTNMSNQSNIKPQIKTNNADAHKTVQNNKQGQLMPKSKKKKKKKKTLLSHFEHLDKKQIEGLNKNQKTEFLFEMAEKIDTQDNENINNLRPGEFHNYIKSSYHIDKDISNLNGIELNNYLKDHTTLKKVDLKNLQKIADTNTINTYIKNFEGVLPDVNLNKRIIREYVDQVLDNELDKKFGDFIVKMRDMYHKKKQLNPLKAKKRFVVGMREIEKHIRLDEVKCLVVVPNIEKVEGENSLDDRVFKIFKDCEIKKIPKIFGLNKFKLGKLARKKHSCVSMLGFVNVEGFEREFRDLIEFAEKFRNKFYENYQTQKETFNDNRFINLDLFKENNAN